MTMTIALRGYPEAVLAADVISLDLHGGTNAGGLVRGLASRSDRLTDALLHKDGTPRRTTKVLVGGTAVHHDSVVDTRDSVTVLASLPCDG